MTIRIGYDRAVVAALQRPDRCTACPFFHRVVQAADQEEGHVKIKRANNETDEYRRNYRVFDGGRTAIVAPYCGNINFRHCQSNRIQAVLVIGVANVSPTVMP